MGGHFNPPVNPLRTALNLYYGFLSKIITETNLKIITING